MVIDAYDVVKKLIGEIDPVGETNTDNDRLENLEAMTDLVNKLVMDIDSVAENKGHHAFSVKRAGEHADKFLSDVLGISER